MAQRLGRRICNNCAVDRAPADEVLAKVGAARRLSPVATWRSGRGCEKCRQTGYSGRAAIHELLVVNEEVRGLISGQAPDHEIRAAGRRAGMHGSRRRKSATGTS